jgi:hypothetical protein
MPGPDAGQITLTWTNPTDTDFAGVMIRYHTDGTYPQNKVLMITLLEPPMIGLMEPL